MSNYISKAEAARRTGTGRSFFTNLSNETPIKPYFVEHNGKIMIDADHPAWLAYVEERRLKISIENTLSGVNKEPEVNNQEVNKTEEVNNCSDPMEKALGKETVECMNSISSNSSLKTKLLFVSLYEIFTRDYCEEDVLETLRESEELYDQRIAALIREGVIENEE